MFTGLVQDIGEIISVKRKNNDVRLRIGCALDLKAEKIGASICCSGVCLTAVEIGPDWFDVEVSAESLSKTVIGTWEKGTKVNLEPSLRLGDELGGHFVFGHVDGVATLAGIEQDGESWRLTIKPPRDLMGYIAPKGSVSLNGVSLTVNEVDADTFGVNIIPHTWDKTNLSTLQKGDRMHIEIDMLARYVARMVEYKMPEAA